MTLPQTPSFRLDGKHALVVGGSRGIGFGCAVALAEAGAQVTVVARTAARLHAAVAEMVQHGLRAEALVLDVTETATMQGALAKLAPVDILVNAAGFAQHSPALETTADAYDVVSDLNIKAAYFLAQAAAKHMVGRGGSIIQISSQMGHVGGPERAVYCATKHAVEGMTKAMAIDWGADNIRVNTLCPTFILTDLSRQSFDDPETRAWIERNIKLPRVGRVEDIMGACLFLASEASAMVTGTSLVVDGGWTAE